MKKITRKLRNNSGFTLIELLVTILILVILVIAIGDGMDAASRIYKQSVFYSNSSTLASMLNTSFEDLFRFSEQIYTRVDGDYITADGHMISGSSVPGTPALLFTNEEYGARNAYVFLSDEEEGESVSPIRIRNVFGGQVRDLLTTGSYPNLKIENLEITYDGPVYTVKYDIVSKTDASLRKSVEMNVRLLNQYRQ